MSNYSRLILATAVLFGAAVSAYSQEDSFVSAGFETNTIYYVQDAANSATVPEGSLGSNNYLKVDFGRGMFEGGLQVEDYMPALQGYPTQLNGFSLSGKYIRLRDGGFSATVGDFYEQFGSGLLFRAYEERALGLNTSIEGVHIAYSYSDAISVKALAGRPRQYLSYSSDSRVAGADLALNLSSLAGIEAVGLRLEGSFFNKHQALENPSQADIGMSPDINGISARAAFDWKGLSVKAEYVDRTADVCAYNMFNTEHSKAILGELSWYGGGLGANLTFRKLANASFQSSYNEMGMFTCLNYIPALTQQHTYSLASLNPYMSQMNGEIGGQADLYYFFPRKTLLGGSRGMRTHLNFSTYYGPRATAALTAEYGNELYFQDLTVDAERWWGSKLKTIIFYTWQIYNARVGTHPANEYWTSHTIVADATYKFDKKNSLRLEYQALFSMQDRGNWTAGTLEYTISPGWSFSISDMWNYGYTGTHYFNGSIAYSKSATRYALSGGRFKEGYQCAGGVCRIIPAYTGVNLSITTSF